MADADLLAAAAVLMKEVVDDAILGFADAIAEMNAMLERHLRDEDVLHPEKIRYTVECIVKTFVVHHFLEHHIFCLQTVYQQNAENAAWHLAK